MNLIIYYIIISDFNKCESFPGACPVLRPVGAGCDCSVTLKGLINYLVSNHLHIILN